MPPVLAVIFWIWFAVSVVVLIRRRSQRRAQRAAAAELAEETAVDAPSLADAPPPVPEHQPQMAMAASAIPTPPAVVHAAPTPPPGFVEAAAPVLERTVPRSAPAAGIADALVGIRMPCDLVPLVFDRLATDKITLSTTGFPAEVVGRSLADEVERLGYVVHPLSDREVIATRGVTELRMMIKPPQADGRHHDHPNARDDAVVVEIALS